MSRITLKSESLWSSSGFKKVLGWSCAGHLFVPLVLTFAPRSFSAPAPPLPVFVDVVAAVPNTPPPPAEAPPKPAEPAPPPPEAAPPKPQRQVVEEAVVIPNTPRDKPARKRPPKPPEKPPESPPEKPPEKPPEQPAEPTPSAADLMAALRQEAEASQPTENARAGAPGTADPELAAYFRKVKSCLYANWVGAREYARRRNLFVRFSVTVGADGEVRGVDLVQSSGIRQLDDTAERAIYKCSPLGAPPGNSSVISLTFVPGELG